MTVSPLSGEDFTVRLNAIFYYNVACKKKIGMENSTLS
jgi:hypothetical protein